MTKNDCGELSSTLDDVFFLGPEISLPQVSERFMA